MKKLLFLSAILLSIQNFSYAKLIELEKCYSTKRILNSSGTDYEKPEDLKWSEDYYKIRFTGLYHIFDPKDSGKIIKIDDRVRKLGENLNYQKYFGEEEIGPKEIKNILNKIKQYEKQGYNKVFPTHELFFSIDTKSGIITRTRIYSADEMISIDHGMSWYEFQRKKEGKPYHPWNIDKITNWKYKIDNYSGGIIQATEIGSNKPQKIAINLKNNLIILITDMSFGNENNISNTYAICKSTTGSKGTDSYTKYWWAVILIAAVIFFIYTQTGRELKIRK